MELKVIRRLNSEKSCIGELYIDGQFFCNTLEDKVRPDGIKVQGQTAIPAGKYRLKIDWSNRFQKMMPHIMDVPCFTGVRIHSGNSAKDTDGCVILGSWGGEDDFISGGVTKGILKDFIARLKTLIKTTEDKVTITITDEFKDKANG